MEPSSQTAQMNVGDLKVTGTDDVPVFLSYSREDAQWVNRLIAALLRIADLERVPQRLAFDDVGSVEDADPSAVDRLPTEHQVVLAFYSDQYVSSPGTRIHQTTFLKSSLELRAGVGVRVRPLHDEGSMELLPADGSSFATAEDPAAVLEQTAREVLAALREAGVLTMPPQRSPLEYLVNRWPLAEGARAIVERACADTAKRGPRATVNTAALLLATIESGSATAGITSADWAAEVLAPAARTLRDRKHSGVGERLSGNLAPPVSAGVGTVLDDARTIAKEASASTVIEERHLLAAILWDRRDPPSRALELVAQSGMDLTPLRFAFFDFVRSAPGEDEAGWSHILLGGIEEAPRHTAFHADDRQGADFLGITPDVLAFAGLIAARTVKPPLSIGLFGEWGSGKTFFMNQLQQQVERIARDADDSRQMQRDLAFYKRIIQIEFNAWHYVEGNLWASLVQHIFDNLRFADEKRRSASQKLQEHLLKELGHEKHAQARAQREKESAEAQVREAKAEVSRARAAFDTKAEELAALTGKNVLAVVPGADLRQRVQPTFDALGLTDVGDSALALQTTLAEARTLLTRGRSVATPLLYGAGRGRRWTWLVATLLLGPALAILIAWVLRGYANAFPTVAAWASGLAGLLSSGVLWVRAQLTRADGWVRQVEDAQRALDERISRAQAENQQRIHEAEERLRRLEADYAAALSREAEAERKVQEAQTRFREASLVSVLDTFVESRANSDDYRKHLGTLALIRNDFEQLSELIEQENWRLDPPAEGEDTSRHALKKFETVEEENRDRAQRVNRIVLYIDDLDRCPPAKVVEVLQAVHLLLAFPLFVVVVGVDARWVTRSIETRYRELLKEESRNTDDFRELFGAATAHDYLEKIFQVPFWLRPMTDVATRQMVEGLLAGSVAESAAAEEGEGAGPTTEGAREKSPADPRSVGGGAATGEVKADIGDAPALTPLLDGHDTGRRPSTETPSTPPATLAPESLQIQPGELEFMRDLAPLLGRSPRALKRFVNVYRLVKAGLSPEQHRAFLAGEEGRLSDSRAVLFLLAVDTGAPRAAAAVLHALRGPAERRPEEQPAESLRRLVEEVEESLEAEYDWRRVRAWLEPEPGRFRLRDDVPALRRAAGRVRRFSFHTGRTDGAARKKPEPAEPAQASA